MSEKAVQDEAPVDFVTLGMFIIDEIHPPPSSNAPPQLDIIGGAGTYSALGARILSPSPSSRSIGWIVDAGPDFPPPIHSTLTSWDTTLRLRPRDGPTTRGWNGYSGNEHRAFKYLTPKKRLDASDLDDTLLASRSFHLICSAARCSDVSQDISRRREALQQHDIKTAPAKPLIIWEPVPDLCTPAELPATLAALQHVDVLSPNHEELAAYFSFDHPDSSVDRTAVETHVRHVLTQPSLSKLAVVVRAGKEGCFVASTGPDGEMRAEWLPAYHRDVSKVRDPTGGGNAFLGGLAVGLVRLGGDVRAAACWGSVAASFAIEQVGVPILTTTDDGREQWNGEDAFKRMREMEKR